MPSTALERVDPIQALTEEPWVKQINKDQWGLVKATIAKGLTDAEVGQFLELARSLGMNPWAHEIWAAKGQGRDGQEGRVLIMVGRDGLISHAERNFDDYVGYDSGVVYANDNFGRVEPDPAAASMRARAGIVHHQAHPKDRGEVLGAWAVAERTGRPPRYFYAALDEYMPAPGPKRTYSPWGSAVAVMIEKVPISIVHRTLCGLGSVYLEEEVARGFDVEGTAIEEPGLEEAVSKHISVGVVAQRALTLMEEQNDLAPNSWSAAKVELVFKGKSTYRQKQELAAIEKANDELRAGIQAENEGPADEPGAGEEEPPADAPKRDKGHNKPNRRVEDPDPDVATKHEPQQAADPLDGERPQGELL